jgi:chemotaxis protein histidine kinase CheA
MWFGMGLIENRAGGIDARDRGDVYLTVLRRFGRELSADGLPPSDEASRWRTITDGEIKDSIERLIAEEYPARTESGGSTEADAAAAATADPAAVAAGADTADAASADTATADAAAAAAATADAADAADTADADTAADTADATAAAAAAAPTTPDAELNKYRMRRISRTVTLAAQALTRQIRESRVDSIYYETAFGEKGDFPPVTTASGKTRVEGRIDRVDILDGGYARITDYKSGAQKFSPPDAASGYQLQLMLYLKAVSESYKPAGIFYFTISEPRTEDYGGGNIAEEIIKSVKPDGVAVKDARSLAAMGIDPDGKSKKGIMEAEEFNELRDSVSALVDDLIESMSRGRVDAEPKTAINLTSNSRKMKACDYCHYKGVCNYDPLFE